MGASWGSGIGSNLGPVDFSLFALSAVAEDIVVAGPEGPDQPLAVVPRLTIQLGPGVVEGLNQQAIDAGR